MTVQAKQTRHYGLDLLRILSMGLIVLLHEYLYGGLLALPEGRLDHPAVLMGIMFGIEFVRAKLFGLIERRNWYKRTMNRIDQFVIIIGDKLFEIMGRITE